MQVPGSKAYYSFVGGLNTEVSDLLFPDNMSKEEENFELLVNGSRRKRKGMQFEEDAVSFNRVTPQTSLAPGRNPIRIAYTEHSWRHVSGNPEINFVCQQIGSEILIFEDDRVTYSDKFKHRIMLSDFRAPNATENLVRVQPVQYASGRGDLVITGEFIEPLLVTYDQDADDFNEVIIPIRERDFFDADPTLAVEDKPATLTNEQLYDLLNRGWTNSLITAYETAQSEFPAKNQIPWLGLQEDSNGINQFVPAKLDAEYFKDVSSPRGHYLVNSFNNNEYFGSGGTATFGPFDITTWSISDTSIPDPIVTITTNTAHGFTASDKIEIVGQDAIWENILNFVDTYSFDGEYTVIAAPTSTTFTIQIDFTPFNEFNVWVNQFFKLGQTRSAFTRTGDNIVNTNRRFKACAFYAGRAWYAGCPAKGISSRLYFSQIVENLDQYGKCYQSADPTDKNIPDLIETDGGVINIPELGPVVRMVPFNESLLVFTEDGVWEISGGFREYFSALSYQVRKIADSKVYAPYGISMSEDKLFYAAGDGLHIIRLDPQAGILIDENISEERVQSLWMSMPGNNWAFVKSFYDPVKKRVWWLWNNEPGARFKYNYALIFDTRLLAYFQYKFHTGTSEDGELGDYYISGVSVPRFFCCQNEVVAKFLTVDTTENLSGRFWYSELLDETTWKDWDFDFVAFLVTGAELFEDGSRRKQSPQITTFMRRTETGFEEIDGDLVPKNESGCFMRARWDWADSAESGKWSQSRQIYKHRRFWQPENDSDPFENGHPVVVQRDTVRGSGRALSLEFRSEEGKPCELLGWSVEWLGNPGV